MRVGAILGFVFFFLSLLVQPAVSQIPDDQIIVPGQRVGKWTLDATLEEMTTAKGPATVREIRGQVEGFHPVVLYLWNDLVAATHDRKRIDFLYTASPAFRTDKGIGYDSSRQSVMSSYGRPTAYTSVLEVPGAPYPLKARLIYDRIGFAVDLTMDSASLSIVFRPGSARSHWVF